MADCRDHPAALVLTGGVTVECPHDTTVEHRHEPAIRIRGGRGKAIK
jgi:hypothetical protein